MKIICTNEEKQTFLNAYENNTDLSCILVNVEADCANKYSSCRECLEQKIEWELRQKARRRNDKS